MGPSTLKRNRPCKRTQDKTGSGEKRSRSKWEGPKPLHPWSPRIKGARTPCLKRLSVQTTRWDSPGNPLNRLQGLWWLPIVPENVAISIPLSHHDWKSKARGSTPMGVGRRLEVDLSLRLAGWVQPDNPNTSSLLCNRWLWASPERTYWSKTQLSLTSKP